MLAVCLLAFIAMSITAVPATTPTTTPQPPDGIPQCAIYECPVYTTLEEIGSDMWKRRVEPSVWVHKVAPTCDRTEAIGLVIGDLDAYLVDNNINESTPIILKVAENIPGPNSSCTGQSGSFPCCDQIYELFHFIPVASQETAPIPSQDSGIQLLHFDAFELYGITFLGPNHNAVEQYEQLREYLDEQGILYYGTFYYIAIYDFPSDPQPHRTEILISI
ncbi:uncharacterized protein LOC115929341 [Strongylocentrotus purpuratus]|uniref:Uncharacterized protein n=1 Tax=Strongylocentrotus purpuratus TaxID=7668 RepID=A0A7M7PMH1_STRPU|nr:uncharacterized protein LOC115929011 [Strongylocentrotus purpuratus]XP_030852905.1 uncharacterized protein LOC115929018 [Strongylocentrotus purpuratus]XP_030854001.1 uncharacterized protein LOC115929341 [Strongylocentrotus purpuratus]